MILQRLKFIYFLFQIWTINHLYAITLYSINYLASDHRVFRITTGYPAQLFFPRTGKYCRLFRNWVDTRTKVLRIFHEHSIVIDLRLLTRRVKRVVTTDRETFLRAIDILNAIVSFYDCNAIALNTLHREFIIRNRDGK